MSPIPYKKVREEEPVFKPTKREKDADYDLYCSSPVVIPVGAVMPVNTNLSIQFPNEWEGKIEDKSGLAIKSGVHVLGGVIDNMYTGEIVIIVANLGKTPVSFAVGNKVAQLQLRPCSPHFSFEETSQSLKATERGDKGFGSQGV